MSAKGFHTTVAVVLSVAVVGVTLSLSAGWPGGITADMAPSISEGLHFRFSGHMTPFMGLAWSVPLRFFGLQGAVALFFIGQTLAYWSVFALFGLVAARHGSWFGAGLAALWGFLPPLLGYSVVIESNVQMGVAAALAVAIAAALPWRSAVWVSVPLVFYAFSVRHGTIFVVPGLLWAIFSLADSTKRWPVVARRTAATMGGFVVASALITATLPGAPKSTRILGISLLVDVVGVYEITGEHCIPSAFVPASTSAETIMAAYEPKWPARILWDTKEHFVLPDRDSRAFDELQRCWFQTVRRHPMAYLHVKARYAKAFLMLGEPWAQRSREGDYSNNAGLGLTVPANRVNAAFNHYLDASLKRLVWRGWCWILVVGVACLGALIGQHGRRGEALALYAAGLGAFVPHVLFGQGALSRYYVPSYMLMTSSLLLLAAVRSPRATQSGVISLATKRSVDFHLGRPLLAALQPVVRTLGLLLRRDHRRDPVRSILVAKFRGVGSLVAAKPALAALRRAHPTARIVFWGAHGMRAIAREMPEFDEVLIIDDRTLVGAAVSVMATVRRSWRLRFDWALDLEVYSRLSSILVTLTCARNRIGFALDQVRSRRRLHTHLIYFNPHAYVGEAYARVVAQLLPSGAAVDPADYGAWRLDDTAPALVPRPYVVVNIHAGDLALERRWPRNAFDALITELQALKPDATAVLIGFGADEVAYSAGVSPRPRLVDLSGRLDLPETIRLLRNAELVVTNDSAPLHLAASVAAPVVGLFGPTLPVTYLNPACPKAASVRVPIYCSPCIHHWEPPPCGGDNQCMKRMTVGQVLAACCRLWGVPPPETPPHLRGESAPSSARYEPGLVFSRTDDDDGLH